MYSDAPFHLSKHMSHTQFEAILLANMLHQSSTPGFYGSFLGGQQVD